MSDGCTPITAVKSSAPWSSPEAYEAPAFVPVVVAEGGAATPAEMPGRMEIALGPAVVRVGADVDAAALRRVLEVVRDLT